MIRSNGARRPLRGHASRSSEPEAAVPPSRESEGDFLVIKTDALELPIGRTGLRGGELTIALQSAPAV